MIPTPPHPPHPHVNQSVCTGLPRGWAPANPLTHTISLSQRLGLSCPLRQGGGGLTIRAQAGEAPPHKCDPVHKAPWTAHQVPVTLRWT